jgi:predicted enzyme related to lactoylglutathione lyase
MADRFFWYELMTTDRNAALDYYEAVVGWIATEQAAASPDIGYTILSVGGRGMGGVIQLSKEMLDGGARPGWVGYINVGDTDARAKAIVEAGGKVLKEIGRAHV